MADERLSNYLRRLSSELECPIEEESPQTLLDMICLDLERNFLKPENNEDFDYFQRLGNYAQELKRYHLEAEAKELFFEMTYKLVAPFFQPVYAKLLSKLGARPSIDLFRYGKHLSHTSFKPEIWSAYQHQSRQKPLMLVLDPNPQLGTMFQQYLDKHFPNKLLLLNAGDSGTLGLLYALSFRPDFIFTDGPALYSYINGYEMLAYLKKFPETQDIPFSLVTTSSPSYIPPLILNEAQNYLQKPFDLAEFDAAIQKHLDILSQ